jgi:hypothetical protein
MAKGSFIAIALLWLMGILAAALALLAAIAHPLTK